MTDKPDDGGPAFAAGTDGPQMGPVFQQGATLWDMYAAQALAGVSAAPFLENSTPEHLASLAAIQADAMIAEKRKRWPLPPAMPF